MESSATTTTMDSLVLSGSTNGVTRTTTWSTPTLVNSWVNYGGSYQTARYCKLDGIVFIQGLVKSGTIGSTIFTLPTGYRPTDIHLIKSGMAGSNVTVRDFRIHTTGSITCTIDNSWVSLTCCFGV